MQNALQTLKNPFVSTAAYLGAKIYLLIKATSEV